MYVSEKNISQKKGKKQREEREWMKAGEINRRTINEKRNMKEHLFGEKENKDLK